MNDKKIEKSLTEILKKIQSGDDDTKVKLLEMLKEGGIPLAKPKAVVKSYSVEEDTALKFANLVDSQKDKKIGEAVTEALHDYIEKYSPKPAEKPKG